MPRARFRRGLDRVDATHASQAEWTTAIILVGEGADDFVLRRHLPGQTQAVVFEVFIVVGHAAQIRFVEQSALSLVEVAALDVARRAPPPVSHKEPEFVLFDRAPERSAIVVGSPNRNVILQAPGAQRVGQVAHLQTRTGISRA